MTLPSLLVLTDRARARRPLVEVVAAAVDGGARAVVLREKDLPRRERAALAGRLRPVLAAVGGALLVASDPTIPADGVHLAATDPMPEVAADERAAGRGPWIGRSCHGRDDLHAAVAAGCTHATLSPVFPTRSKPGYGPALGVGTLADAPLPTFALGGVDRPERVAACLAAGAHGVAVMGAVMRAEDPARTTADLLAATADVPPPTRNRP